VARTCIPVFILALAIGVSPPLLAQTIASSPAGQIVTETQAGGDVATGLDLAMRMTVPVMINGKGPFQFVVDTGASRTVISEDLAKQLALPSAGTARLHAMGGSANVRMVRINTVEVSTNKKKGVEAAALPRRYVGADGLLGIDSMKGQRIVMDFVAHTMRVEPSTMPEEPVPPEADLIIVTARTRLGQLVMVDADANGQKIWVVVDTGAQNTVANSKLRALLVKRIPETEIRPINMVDVLGHNTPAEYTIVSKLRIGGVSMGNAAIAFADAHPFKLFGLTKKPSMLMGVESLRSFRRVSVDFSTRKVSFLLPEDR
jgi:predicted aspartyl protease